MSSVQELIKGLSDHGYEDALREGLIQDLDSQVGTLKIDNERLQSIVDALTKSNTTLFGQSFGATPQIGEQYAQAARIFLQGVDATTWAKDPEIQRAVKTGKKVFVLSHKDQSTEHVKAFLNSIPDGYTVYVCFNHEPENDHGTPGSADYNAWSDKWESIWAVQGPLIRTFGFIPTFIDMAWTLYPGSKRDFDKDWSPPKSSVDVCGFDNYYNKFDPKETLDRAVAAAKSVGLPLLIGETGTTAADPKSIEKAKIYRKGCVDNNVLVACYWPVLDKNGFDARWNDATMRAWYNL